MLAHAQVQGVARIVRFRGEVVQERLQAVHGVGACRVQLHDQADLAGFAVVQLEQREHVPVVVPPREVRVAAALFALEEAAVAAHQTEEQLRVLLEQLPLPGDGAQQHLGGRPGQVTEPVPGDHPEVAAPATGVRPPQVAYGGVGGVLAGDRHGGAGAVAYGDDLHGVQMVHGEPVQPGQQAEAARGDVSAGSDGVAGAAGHREAVGAVELGGDVPVARAGLDAIRVHLGVVGDPVHGADVDDDRDVVAADEVLVTVAAGADGDPARRCPGTRMPVQPRVHGGLDVGRARGHHHVLRRGDPPLVEAPAERLVAVVARTDLDRGARAGASGRGGHDGASTGVDQR